MLELMKMTAHLHLSVLASSPPSWAAAIAGTLVLITVTLSAYLVFEHLSAYKNPEEQKFLISVILMVPCYSVESFISLADPSISVYCEILRDCYEAFAMYSFGRYLVACLGGEERTIEFMRRQGRTNAKTPLLQHSSEKGVVKHPFPMNCFVKPWKLGLWFYQVVKFGIVQYMLIKCSSAILALILEAFGVYCEGEFNLKCGYPYIAVVLNFSQSWALYCLVQFYTVTKDELEHIKPLAKFLTFKSIVFLTWWQGVLIALFCDLGLFKNPIAQGLQFKSSIQAFIICIEVIHIPFIVIIPLILSRLLYGLLQGLAIFPFLADWLMHCHDVHPGNCILNLLAFPVAISLIWSGRALFEWLNAFSRWEAQMTVASMVHLYVFPAKPYELLGDHFRGNVSVLGDYSADCPLDPDEVRDSERPTKIRLPQPDIDVKSGMTIRESVKDVVFGGGEYIVNDVKFTVHKAVDPMEKGFTRFNEKLHKISENIKKHDKDKRKIKDDSYLGSQTRRVIRGIDDPLLNGSFSDSGVVRSKRHRRKSGYASAESGGESSSDQSYGGYQIRGGRWVTKD